MIGSVAIHTKAGWLHIGKALAVHYSDVDRCYELLFVHDPNDAGQHELTKVSNPVSLRWVDGVLTTEGRFSIRAYLEVDSERSRLCVQAFNPRSGAPSA